MEFGLRAWAEQVGSGLCLQDAWFHFRASGFTQGLGFRVDWGLECKVHDFGLQAATRVHASNMAGTCTAP